MEIRWPNKTTACRYNPPWAGDMVRGPHCDPYVVHGPEECDACDENVEAQAERIHQGINFTGQSQLGRETCPAERQRSLDVIHAWPGNRPIKKGTVV